MGASGEAKKLSRESERNVTCIYRSPEIPDIWAQLNLIQNLVRNETSTKLHGIIVIPLSPSSRLTPIINEAVQNGIQVVVINKDIPDSMWLAQVATDNYDLGRTLGNILLQLRPNGGDYAALRVEGEIFDLRERGLSEYIADTPWKLLSDKTVPENIDLMLELMEAFPIEKPSLSEIVPLGGWPMYRPEFWISFVEEYQNKITFVSA
jgi:ribose transport system substrate-binding protein